MKLVNLVIIGASLVLSGVVLAEDQPAVPATDTPAAVTQTTTEVKQTVVTKDVKVLVNINEADAKALMAVKLINKKRAEAIVDYRTKNGPFKSVNDLAKIKGFNKKLVKKLSKKVTV